jgi:hypothetical protein
MVIVTPTTGIELNPKQLEKIKVAQRCHAAHDPGCVNLTPEECIQWHPVNGMTWEERARLMRERGIVEPDAPEQESGEDNPI